MPKNKKDVASAWKFKAWANPNVYLNYGGFEMFDRKARKETRLVKQASSKELCKITKDDDKNLVASTYVLPRERYKDPKNPFLVSQKPLAKDPKKGVKHKKPFKASFPPKDTQQFHIEYAKHNGSNSRPSTSPALSTNGGKSGASGKLFHHTMSDSMFLNSTHSRAARHSNLMLRPSTAPVLSSSGSAFEVSDGNQQQRINLLPLSSPVRSAPHPQSPPEFRGGGSLPTSPKMGNGGGSGRYNNFNGSHSSNNFALTSASMVGQGIDLCNEVDLSCLAKRVRGSAKRALARESFESVPRSLHGVSLVDDLAEYPLEHSHSKRFTVSDQSCVEVYPDDLSPKSSVVAGSQFMTHFIVHNTGPDISRFRIAVVQADFVQSSSDLELDSDGQAVRPRTVGDDAIGRKTIESMVVTNDDAISFYPTVGKLALGISKKINVSVQVPRDMIGTLHGVIRVSTAPYLFEIPITCQVVLDRFEE